MTRLSLLVLAAVTLAGPALAQDEAARIERGRYLATAADCAACHRTAEPDGAPFAGGYAIASPMGRIVASNITPSTRFGIGGWSEEQFARALREGMAPDGHLYPAMPYTAYATMPDADVHAIWTYLTKAVAPVEAAPAARTALSFPFDQRWLMAGWNLVFNRATPMDASAVAEGGPNRGKYLVDGLAHCFACHSPRNALMGEDNGAGYLSGGDVGGWHAPNITPDPVSGGPAAGPDRDRTLTAPRPRPPPRILSQPATAAATRRRPRGPAAESSLALRSACPITRLWHRSRQGHVQRARYFEVPHRYFRVRRPDHGRPAHRAPDARLRFGGLRQDAVRLDLPDQRRARA
ncbi:cytochrome c [Frigidibacter sp. MR17.14]|uniref:cytochrome c n=1 Tax=Frigidibacter sp. MR17.14 TaxID=3126509 RepID=UPI003012F220